MSGPTPAKREKDPLDDSDGDVPNVPATVSANLKVGQQTADLRIDIPKSPAPPVPQSITKTLNLGGATISAGVGISREGSSSPGAEMYDTVRKPTDSATFGASPTSGTVKSEKGGSAGDKSHGAEVVTNVDEFDPRELARLYVQQQAALRSMRGEFDFLAVPDWVQLHPLLGAYVAESFGTFAFVLTLSLVSVRNETSMQFNKSTNMTSLPIGFMLMCMVFTFGYISGGHFNPAVTIAVFLSRKIDLARTIGYVICQNLAALGAGLVAMSIQGNRDIFVPSVNVEYVSSGIFSELIFTFAVALVVLNVAYSRQSGNFFYGFAIGMTVSAGSASVGGISGGAFNPAAATGLQLAMCLTGECSSLTTVWVYWLAPLVGAALASLLFSQMYQPEDTQALHDSHVVAVPTDHEINDNIGPAGHMQNTEAEVTAVESDKPPQNAEAMV